MRKFIAPLLAAAASYAAELPIKDALLLHLDARAQQALRASAGLPGIAHAGPLDRWLDSSSNALHAVQLSATGRPVFRADDVEAFVRFDGKDDFLAVASAQRRAKEVTLFVLAAPRGNHGAF